MSSIYCKLCTVHFSFFMLLYTIVFFVYNTEFSCITLDTIVFFRSMLPDVVDKAFIEQGVRREELFYSFYVFFSKFGAGVSLGISTLILK